MFGPQQQVGQFYQPYDQAQTARQMSQSRAGAPGFRDFLHEQGQGGQGASMGAGQLARAMQQYGAADAANRQQTSQIPLQNFATNQQRNLAGQQGYFNEQTGHWQNALNRQGQQIEFRNQFLHPMFSALGRTQDDLLRSMMGSSGGGGYENMNFDAMRMPQVPQGYNFYGQSGEIQTNRPLPHGMRLEDIPQAWRV
jgi:hypothetical protein